MSATLSLSGTVSLEKLHFNFPTFVVTLCSYHELQVAMHRRLINIF